MANSQPPAKSNQLRFLWNVKTSNNITFFVTDKYQFQWMNSTNYYYIRIKNQNLEDGMKSKSKLIYQKLSFVVFQMYLTSLKGNEYVQWKWKKYDKRRFATQSTGKPFQGDSYSLVWLFLATKVALESSKTKALLQLWFICSKCKVTYWIHRK